MNREEITSELSAKVLAKLRRENYLVAREVWVDPDHRVDFVAFKPLPYADLPASIERGCFTFVEVKSCMDDFRSGHGLTFDGDINTLVCPWRMCDQLRETASLPRNVNVLCLNGVGSLVRRIEAPSFGVCRKATATELLWRMVCASAECWRSTRKAVEE